MTGSVQGIGAVAASQTAIEIRDDEFVVDAALVGELPRLPVSRVQTLMRSGGITSSCERGIDEDAGEFSLSFFHGNRRARLNTDLAGRILRKSAVEFGDRPISRTRPRLDSRE